MDNTTKKNITTKQRKTKSKKLKLKLKQQLQRPALRVRRRVNNGLGLDRHSRRVPCTTAQRALRPTQRLAPLHAVLGRGGGHGRAGERRVGIQAFDGGAAALARVARVGAALRPLRLVALERLVVARRLARQRVAAGAARRFHALFAQLFVGRFRGRRASGCRCRCVSCPVWAKGFDLVVCGEERRWGARAWWCRWALRERFFG